jgi:hypothetical protein
MKIRTELLNTSSSNNYWSSNSDLFNVFSSRQRLVLAPPERIRKTLDFSLENRQASWVTIQDKTNWARSQVLDIRKHHVDLKAHTTARQVDYLARGFQQALNRPQAKRRKPALDNLKNQIYVDTRNNLGRPKIWPGLPVTPAPHSKAWLQRRNGDWQLWIEHAGVAKSVLASLNQSSNAAVPDDRSGFAEDTWSADETDLTCENPAPTSCDHDWQGEQLDQPDATSSDATPGWLTPEAKASFSKRKAAHAAHIASITVPQPKTRRTSEEQPDGL